ncbi:MAG TPA: rhomboid family intramembrane serine protease [Sumerlaeia bacterium]|nr:rhomboid family intramembrane serine protease [Sumerlaeia bacterium]
MFFFFPYGVDRPLRRAPVVTYWLLGVNTAVYVLHFWALPAAYDVRPDEIIRTFGFTFTFEAPWRILTYMFFHGNVFHYLFNMFFLFLTGGVVEDKVGRRRALILYLVGGVAAALVHGAAISLTGGSRAPLVGASGAIAALMGAFCVLMPWTDFKMLYFFPVLLLYPTRHWLGTFGFPAVFLLGTYFLLGNVFRALGSHPAGAAVAYWAHIGGFAFGAVAAGLLYGFQALWLTPQEMRRREREKKRAEIEAARRFLAERRRERAHTGPGTSAVPGGPQTTDPGRGSPADGAAENRAHPSPARPLVSPRRLQSLVPLSGGRAAPDGETDWTSASGPPRPAFRPTIGLRLPDSSLSADGQDASQACPAEEEDAPPECRPQGAE